MKILILSASIIAASLYFGANSITPLQKNFTEVSLDATKQISKKESMFAANPSDFSLAIEIASDSLNMGDYKTSETYFQKAKEVRPKEKDSYMGLGFLYRYQGLMDKSLEEYQKALALNPDSSEIYLEIGKLYRNWEKYQEAETAFKKAIELNPNNDSIYSYGLGYLYRDMGELKTAEKYFLKAFELNKNEFNYGALGDIYRDMGKFEESEKMFLKAIELNPGGENVGGLAWLYMERKNYPQAEKYFREYLTRVRPKGEMYYGLAQSLFGQKRYNEAETEMTKALKLNHKTEVYYDFLRSIFLTNNKPNLAWAVSARKNISIATD